MQDNQSATRRIYSPLLSSLPPHIDKLESLTIEYYSKLGQGWLQGSGKGRRQWMGCTMDGSDAQPDTFTRHPSPPSLLPSDPHQQGRIVDDGILHYGMAGYKVVEKAGDNEWKTQRTEAMHGQRRKNHVDRQGPEQSPSI